MKFKVDPNKVGTEKCKTTADLRGKYSGKLTHSHHCLLKVELKDCIPKQANKVGAHSLGCNKI